MGASEPDKSLSWEERKLHTIEATRKLPLKNKLVICADKINNLEDTMIKFQKNGKRDFSEFKRGKEQQKWYYTNVYESLIYGEDENLPIFKRFKKVLDIVFYAKEDKTLKETIFADNPEYYEKLKSLHAQKVELQRLKALCSLPKPFIIEFTGTPRTGKTTIINNLYDFFKKNGFKVSVIEEFTTSRYYKETFAKMSPEDRYIPILEHIYKQLLDASKEDKDIILVDRSINDRQIWNYRGYIKGIIPEEIYQEACQKYGPISKELIDALVITYANPLTALKRDYNSSLALEDRSFLNLENLEEYNNSLQAVKGTLQENVETPIIVDTTSMDIKDVSVEIASQTMPAMRKTYIKSIKQKYNLK